MVKNLFTLVVSASILWSCQPTAQPESTLPKFAHDPHSSARPNETVVEHLDLQLNVDFEQEQLSGTATWLLHPTHGDTVIFDVYDLDIERVAVDGESTSFMVKEINETMGQALVVPIDEDVKHVSITYKTTPGARALQWLNPQQTSGKNLPFLFTQSQAILARTWLPCQDSPGIRYTYKAEVTVPKDMLALMSAQNPQTRNAEGVYNFTMDIPIPSYLMALAVGDIAFQAVSDRAGVYAEPDMLEKAAWEFAETEEMIVQAEALYGDYIWGRYDILVLPPAFPFGGMENPRLTFATPTVITGDRSQTSLIAHELAHSWSGNLVTNATWNDFWLNEGFTTYFEMRIMEAVYGRDHSEMIASISHQDMVQDINALMDSEPEVTSLKMKMDQGDPDDGVGAVAYDKGYNFLRLCEETVGRERWDAFLKNYFASNKFKSMDTERFVDQIASNLLSEDEITQIGLEEWIYGTGIPANSPTPHSDRFAKVDTVRLAIRTAFENGYDVKRVVVPEGWSTYEWLHFIRGLEAPTVPYLQALDDAFRFSASPNAEIQAAWWQPTIRAVGGDALPEAYVAKGIKTNYVFGDLSFFTGQVEDFLVRIGRRKFLTPTYRAMVETDQKEWALSIYKKARPNYHAVSRETIDHLLDFHPEVE